MRLLLLVLITVAVSYAAVSPPHAFPMRARGGSLYASSIARHERLSADHGILRNTTVNYFPQLIDHADPVRGTFRQRYWVDDTNWDRVAGPCFIYIGGEGPESGSPSGYTAVVGDTIHGIAIYREDTSHGIAIYGEDTTHGIAIYRDARSRGDHRRHTYRIHHKQYDELHWRRTRRFRGRRRNHRFFVRHS